MRRVRTGHKALTRSLTPHTIAATEKYVFILARSATDNFAMKIPTAAVLKVLGNPDWQIRSTGPRVLDIDPQTTEYTYVGPYPKFMVDEIDGVQETSPDGQQEG